MVLIVLAGCSAALPTSDFEMSGWAEERYKESSRAWAIVQEMDNYWEATSHGVTPIYNEATSEIVVCDKCTGNTRCPDSLDYTNLQLQLQAVMLDDECPHLVSSDQTRRHSYSREESGGEVHEKTKNSVRDRTRTDQQGVMRGFMPRHIFAVYGGRPYNCMAVRPHEIKMKCWNPR